MLAQLSRRFNWDKSGRLVGVKDNKRGASSYQYDPRDQVNRITRQTGLNKQSEEQYSYDALMNLAQSDGRTHRYTNGEIRQIGRSFYRHDARGRLVEKRVDKNGFRPRTWYYRWDDFDRLSETHTPDGAIWAYTYDAFGRRIKKECVKTGNTGRKSSVSYLWQGATLAEEHRTAGETTEVSRWHFEPGTFNPLAKETISAAGKVSFYPIVTDHLGTPKELFDTEGNCVWQAEHSLWGETTVAWQKMQKPDGLQPLVDCSLRFQNQWEDEETGLFYNLNRYYDPDSGQYLSQDPIGLEGGLRIHGYVHDPMQWVDPLGLAGCVLGQNMHERVIPVARKLGTGYLKVSPSKWTWRKNEKFLTDNMNDAKAGRGRIYDIGGQRGRYQGPNAIYTREKVVLENNGFERVYTGKQVTADNGRKFRLYEWKYTGR